MPNKFQINIPEPCHESWNNMTPVEQDRFCNSCQKAVVDFTEMSDAQLITFFKKPTTGSLCGRFNNDQLERDIIVPGKRMPWLKYFLNLLIPAFLISNKARSQGEPRIVGDTVLVDTAKASRSVENCSLNQDVNKIKGRLIDNKGLPIPSGSVIIKGTKIGAATDPKGNFSLPLSDKSKATLVFSSIGFTTKEIIVDTNRTKTCKVGLVPLETAISGEVIIVGMVSPRKKNPIKLFQRMLKDTVAKFFKIFPNPALAGSQTKIELKKAEAGEYIADLINQNGQVVHSSILEFTGGTESNSYSIPTMIAGTYFLRLTNRQSRKYHVEKIVIQ